MNLSAFNWILPGKLAGSAQPGRMGDITEDLNYLWNQGIRVIMTLTEAALVVPKDAPKFGYLHFPIVDMEAPRSMQATLRICKAVHAHIHSNEAVLMHCEMGTGRTGTLLACALIHFGRNPEEVLLELRKIEPLYVRNSIQERFIHRYHTFYTYNH